MKHINKYHSGLLFLFILQLTLGTGLLIAQPEPDTPVAGVPRVESLLIGGHPDYTRILVNLDQPALYQVIPDFNKKKIIVFLPDAQMGEELQSRSFPDRNLERIDVTQLQEGLRVTFRLKHKNTRVFHFEQQMPVAAVVLDFQGHDKPILRARPDTAPPVEENSRSKKTPRRTKTKPRKEAGGLTESQARQIVKEDTEKKISQGWDEYKKALSLYQQELRTEALEAFDEYQKNYPQSPLLENILFLKAETLFQINNPKPFPIYEDVITAYQLAMRRYPKSKFFDHALFKLGVIFDNMDLPLEARTLYLRGIENNKKSLYNKTRQLKMAQMLLREKRFEEAYKAFNEILKNDPNNEEARDSTFSIALSLYELNDFEAARIIFEDASRRWPKQLDEVPEINYYMGEIYFHQKEYKKARKHFFHFINLEPETVRGHKSLNRIGDSYLMENKGLAALSVFDRSQKVNPGSAESQYARIRLADIGVRDPTLPIQDIIFDIPEYFRPVETYQDVFEKAKSQDILAEVTLSRGTAHLQQKQYLEAFREFQKLIAFEKGSRFYKTARNLLEQALVFLIDDYSAQKGYLPILYAYNQFRNLNIGDVRKVETLLQVGESYQAIGMTREALTFYERVKKSDPNGVYRDRLFLNLGKIHVEQGSYSEAEVVARTFLTNFPLSPEVPEAMKILAAAYRGQENFEAAQDIFQQLLSRADADPSEIHYLSGETWFQKGDQEQAIREYALAIDQFDRTRPIAPGHVQDAYYKLGLVLYQAGRYPRALEALISARRLFPTHSLREWADFLIADCYDRQQDKTKAENEFKNLIKASPNEPLLKKAAEIGAKVLDWEKRLKGKL
ncbi:MAG: tetratricopeptide repeat protein [Candidatus Nitronauta litoralis]|uniref:Tetratricopeptide repeat protein n=1 Tax=Candidatus Nitronauta litoralis TaxID=2705533 RepID=A0A7T0BU50_9BACT|nr:MAG: tetratricopeptide repeat protein [Candidatus Nitronauta litoralis]